MRWIVLALGLTSPGAPALLEPANRRPDVLGYYYGVVGRNSPVRR